MFIRLQLIHFFIIWGIILTSSHKSYAITQSSNLQNSSYYYQQYKKDTDSIDIRGYELIRSLYLKNEYSLALKKGLVLLDTSTKNGSTELSILTYTLIGDIFEKTRSYEKSLKYYKNSLELYETEINDKPQAYNNALKKIDSNYVELLFKTGSVYHKLAKSDSAKYYYNKIIKLNIVDQHKLFVKAKAFNNLSNLYFYSKEKDFDKAEEYALKAIEIKKNIGDKISQAASIASLASVYLEQNKYEKARQYYLKAINLIEKNKDGKSLRFKEVFYDNISWAMYNQKKYQAYNYLDKSFNIRDSLREAEMKDILLKIETNHKENLEKEKTALVEEQRKLKEAQEAKTSMLFGVLSLLVLIVSGVIVYNYKLRQRNLRLKLSESKLIQQQNIEKLKSEAQIKILNATIDGKETERKLIAEILHDNVSALLSSANMHLSATKKQFDGESSQEIQKTQAIISEASQKVRDLSHNLVSSILLKFGLEYAIKDVAKKYSNSELTFKVSAQNISRYNQEFEIKIFNVIQELINNILKHSKAKHAQINLKEENNQLTVLVKDDGVGFSTSSSSFSDGIGLNQIEARIHVMNGKLTIKSKENTGTSIKIIVPILKKEKNIRLTSIS
ncbi:tetratricopeptide repeat-containing sensor histidine kinase [Tenacibaculum sp.]|uniref:tetratricopeptide repeat-containing sensor histidine kinase n=1 Tax=Tenacibaculum sp. TaxID=1906242 RepID=UPI003D11A974